MPELIGVGKYSGELARWLSGRGFCVEVVTTHPHYPGFTRREASGRSYTRTIEDGVRVTRCPLLLRRNGRGMWRFLAPLSFAMSAAPVLLWRAIRSRPAVILCVEPTLLAAPAAMLAAWLIGAKLMLHVQDLEVDAAFATGCLKGEGLRRIGLRLEACLLKRFDKVVTISAGMADRLAAKGVGRRNLAVVRNWTNGEEAPPEAEGLRMRDRLGIGQDEKVILYAGHLGAKQDVPVLLDALGRLARRRPVRVVIAGEGPLASTVATFPIPNLVNLPLQPKDAYAALLATADVHVLPQDARAADLVFPSKLGPMLATGRPVVVSAAPDTDLARWVGESAIVVAPGDAQALAAGLETAIDEPVGARSDPARALARTLDASTIMPVFEAHLIALIGDVREEEAIRARSIEPEPYRSSPHYNA